VLDAFANGTRIEKTSTQLSISAATLNSQLSTIRTLLNTRSTAEVIHRAADLGLLK